MKRLIIQLFIFGNLIGVNFYNERRPRLQASKALLTLWRSRLSFISLSTWNKNWCDSSNSKCYCWRYNIRVYILMKNHQKSLSVRCKHKKKFLHKQLDFPAHYFCTECNKMYYLGIGFKKKWKTKTIMSFVNITT